MIEASIPVDIRNPGQVLACMGFLEVSESLLGESFGGFEFGVAGSERFLLKASGDQNPFEFVLAFLAECSVHPLCPLSERERMSTWCEKKSLPRALTSGETYPDSEVNEVALPLVVSRGHENLTIFHWADGSSLPSFKLYAGNRSSLSIAQAMLFGTRSKPSKKFPEGQQQNLGLQQLWAARADELREAPFGVLTPMGGCFNFDPRAGWTGLDAGYSPNDQNHLMASSPIVEILAAIGLNYARPLNVKQRVNRYGAWKGLLPLQLARAALGAAPVVSNLRVFEFELAMSGKNKIVTFAKEQTK